MNSHALIDSFPVVLAAALFRKSKLFRDSIESPAYEELLNSTVFKWPEIDGEGYYEVPADTLLGEQDPAFHIAQWKGDGLPTIIYHHGNNERPFNNMGFGKNTFKKIFLSKKDEIPANLIVIRAPHHRCFRTYLQHMGRLSTLTALLSVSVKMVEALTEFAISKGSRVVVSGISLGGWVINLHRTFFNSADLYIPLLAGTIPSDVFTNSIYSQLTASPAHENPSAMKYVLDFEKKFSRIAEKNVFPLLARYDQVMQFELQKESYGDHPIAVINKGHFTGSQAADALRRHILSHLLGTPQLDN